MKTLEEMVAELAEASRNIWVASLGDEYDVSEEQKDMILNIAVMVDKLKV